MISSLSLSLASGQVILVRYIESGLFIFGIIGSLLNILLFSQRKLLTNSCCISSSMAAIVLILIGIIPQLYALNHTPDPLFNKNFCKIQGYISQSSAMLCRWLLTIACIDRCLLTSNNAGLRLFSTVHTARKLVLLLCIIWLIFPIHVLIFTDVRKSGYILCMMTTNGAAFYHTIYTIILGGLAPALIMLISIKMIWKSIQLKRQRQGMIHLNTRQNKREKRDIQILIMLLLQVIIFIIFNFPYMSFNLYLACTRTVINKSTDRLEIESFMQLFTEVTVFVYPVASFYSNILVSQKFRHELINLFRRIFICGYGRRFRNRQRIGPRIITATVIERNNLPIIVIS